MKYLVSTAHGSVKTSPVIEKSEATQPPVSDDSTVGREADLLRVRLLCADLTVSTVCSQVDEWNSYVLENFFKHKYNFYMQ